MESVSGHIVNALKFLVMLGVLVFVHELGHFLVARKVGVHIKKFFLGFDIGGLKLLSFKRKETEYGIGVLPLGGYVKMAGQEDLPAGDETAQEKLKEEDKNIPDDMRFDRKPLPGRAAIVVAGPLMNLALGFVLFVAIALIGVDIPRYLSRSVLGSVEAGLPADRAGLKAGDQIIRVEGKEIQDWSDLLWVIRTAASDQPLAVSYLRDGEERATVITPRRLWGSAYPRVGIAPGGEAAVLGLQSGSPAARAGLRAGDIIEAVDGKPVLYPQVEDIISSSPGADLRFALIRPGEAASKQVTVTAGSRGVIPGLYFYQGCVLWVNHRARGEVLKLKKGDRIMGVNGRSLPPDRVARLVEESSPGAFLELDILRKGWMFFKPASRFAVRAEIGREGEISGLVLSYYPEKVLVKYSGLKAFIMGAKMTKDMVVKMFDTIYLLIAGRMEVSELAGPVGIFTITSATRLFTEFITLLALISINLGIINLLPLPVLDGGHLLLFLVEGVRRRPLTPRFIGVVQHIGLIIIITLFLLVTYNDIIHRLLGY